MLRCVCHEQLVRVTHSVVSAANRAIRLSSSATSYPPSAAKVHLSGRKAIALFSPSSASLLVHGAGGLSVCCAPQRALHRLNQSLAAGTRASGSTCNAGNDIGTRVGTAQLPEDGSAPPAAAVTSDPASLGSTCARTQAQVNGKPASATAECEDLRAQEASGDSRCGNGRDGSALMANSTMIDCWFQAIDANRDGFITQREFRTWYCLHFVPTFTANLSRLNKNERQSQEPQADSLKQLPDQFGETLPSLSTAAGRVRVPSGHLAQARCCVRSPADAQQQDLETQQLHQRLLLLEAEGAALREALESGNHREPLPRKLLFSIALRSSIPYIGFGFIDNCLMLLCGELIDLHLGAVLGLTTLAAAGLGNMISCASGVVTGGFVERFVYSLKWLPKAKLSPRQAESTEAHNAHLLGSVTGICIGCILGLLPLLVMPQRPSGGESPPSSTEEPSPAPSGAQENKC